MPIYDYICKGCEHTFSKLLPISKRTQPINDDCPECGKKAVVQTVSRLNVMTDLGKGVPKGFAKVLDKISDSSPRHRMSRKYG